MAKTAIVNKETGAVVGISAGTEGTNKMVLDNAGLTAEQVDFVTAKNFQPTDTYKTFKEMSMTQEERDAAAKKATEAADAAAKKAADKEAKDKEKAEKAAAKAANKPATARNTEKLEGEYHIVKAFPATRADHPKMPIWEAIANNTTVEAAKAACPEKNPPRLTNGVYTFNSEFRYFVKAGYIVMGQRPEGQEAPAEGSEAAESAGGGEAA